MGQLKMYFLLKMGIFQPALLVYQWGRHCRHLKIKSSCFLMRHHCTAARKEFFGSEICAYPKEPYMSPTKKNAWWELLRLWARFISMPPGVSTDFISISRLKSPNSLCTTIAGDPSLLDFLFRCLYNHPISLPKCPKPQTKELHLNILRRIVISWDFHRGLGGKHQE